ncbi:MAG: 50S ribosomal protein L22 [Patescibacteria group bacterium]|nr:50S ribosomal protein L22 [Patescibacteria group bacterium]
MADATAQLSNYRQSPRKVGLVVDSIRGKKVSDVLAMLEHMPKRAGAPLAKLIRSAVASARSKGLMQEELVISKIEVGRGIVFKRSSPRARGSSSLIRKKSSHIKLELSRRAAKKQIPAA